MSGETPSPVPSPQEQARLAQMGTDLAAALRSPTPPTSFQRRGLFSKVKGLFRPEKSPASPTTPSSDNPPERRINPKAILGSLLEKAGEAKSKAGEKLGHNIGELKRGLEEWAVTPRGRATVDTLKHWSKGRVDALLKDVKDPGDLLKKENWVQILEVAKSNKFMVVSALLLMTELNARVALYMAQDAIKNVGGFVKDNYKGMLKDTGVGMLIGGGLRTALITAGAQAYVAAAGATFLYRGGKELYKQLDLVEKPEGKLARLNAISRYRRLSSEKKKEVAVKTLVAGSLGAVGSLVGAEIVAQTGIADAIYNWVDTHVSNAFGGISGGYIETGGAATPTPTEGIPQSFGEVSGISSETPIPAETATPTATEAIATPTATPTETPTPVASAEPTADSTSAEPTNVASEAARVPADTTTGEATIGPAVESSSPSPTEVAPAAGGVPQTSEFDFNQTINIDHPGSTFWESIDVPEGWINENGVTRGDVVKDMIVKFAQHNGHNLNLVHVGDSYNLNELLTPEQLDIVNQAMQTEDTMDYWKNIRPLAQKYF